MSKWSAERAWSWYNAQSWPCGFNYVPAHAISYTEMWMDYSFDPGRIDRELALAEEIGFNCIRVVLPFAVWEAEPAAFERRMDAFLAMCARRRLRVMPALFDDCTFGPISDPTFGKQPEVVPGWYANGWTPSPGHSMVRDSSTWPRLEKYVLELLRRFKDDTRLWVWDLYNEPTGGGIGDVSLPLLKEVIAWARAVDPIQPMTVGVWKADHENLDAICVENSDAITFHDYGSDGPAAMIARFKQLGRPIICTEWLNRPGGATVEKCLPVFHRERVGCMHWGLVNGRTQTNLPWGSRPEKLSKASWQHDLFHGDFTPYDPRELELFRQHIAGVTRDRSDRGS